LRYLGIVTDDIKTSYWVIRELKRMKIPFALIKAGDPIPDHISALILCGGIPPQGYKMAVSYDGNARRTVLKAMSASAGKERFGLVVVGIDPGDCTGVAIIADGELVEAYTVDRLVLKEEIQEILEEYPAERLLFRIGRGSISNEVLARLQGEPRVRTEFVVETKKTLPPKFLRKGLKKDAKSALIIAIS
jgi:uncharacterized protein (DUF433 family)